MRWPYYANADWAVVIGDRIRRLRMQRGMRIADLAQLTRKPSGGGRYSLSHISRIERGWAVSPLYVYLALAGTLDTPPGRLLGQDAAMSDLSEAEATLVKTLRAMRLAPEEALARLATPARRE